MNEEMLNYLIWYLSEQKIPDTPENREAIQKAMEAIERAVKSGALDHLEIK